MVYKELIEWLRRVVEHGDETPQEYCTNRCGGCEVCDQAADAIEALLGERDAAVEELRGYCRACVYARTNKADYPCSECKHLICGTQEIDGWQWRGPQKAVSDSDTEGGV